MPILKVVQYGDEVLRTPTQIVPEKEIKSTKFKAFVVNMIQTMYAHKGVGLAAPQVGSQKRVTVIDTTWNEEDTPSNAIILINPIILESSGELESEEGCLSFAGKGTKPALFIKKVKRARKVKVQYTNLQNKKCTIEAEGDLLARCLQHEIDHLDGVLLIDKVIDESELDEQINSCGYTSEYSKDKGPIL